MTRRELAEYLSDILKAITQVEQFTSGLTFEEFANNPVIFLAVVQAIIVMGEAVKNVPDDLRQNYPDVPWKAIAGMRDKLVHEYWAIDEKVVWKVVQDNAPELKVKIERVLEDWQTD